MKKQLLSLTACLCLIATQLLYGQNPTEKYLNSPNYSEGTQIIPVGIDLYNGNEDNTIHYGKTPSGSSNKPVLIFVHGYASNAQVFFKGDDNMYADVYRDGYRSAYVSLTPNDDMWTNGALLANMITRIKSHYNNAPLVLVGWSKGGVDIDAALVHFGANSQVNEVFTLSTPHFGTSIAELANSVLLSLVNIIFMQNNDATLSLQRGYMNYFRSITDNNSNNTVPYTTIGGWGNGPLNRLDIPQAILHGIDGPRRDGGNDGVVPYNSSIRPGAKELFDGQKKYSGFLGIPYYDGPNETNLDHFEVTRGGKVWPFIKSELNQSNRGILLNTTPLSYNPNQIISSKMQLLIDSEKDYFLVNEHNKNAKVYSLSADQKPIALTDANGLSTSLSPINVQMKNSEHNVYNIDQLSPGKYHLNNELTAAILVEENGPEMLLDFGSESIVHVNKNGKLGFEVLFEGIDNNEQININAYIIQSTDLSLNRTESQRIALEIKKDDDKFQFYSTKSLKAGIYQIIINAEGDHFKRDLLTSFAITEVFNPVENSGHSNNWSVYPNPAKDIATIQFDITSGHSQLTIYSIKGEIIKQQTVGADTKSVKLEVNEYQSGLYVVEITQADGKKFQKLLVVE